MENPTRTANDRIRVLLDLVRDLSQIAEPKQVLRRYARTMIDLDGPRGYMSLSVRGLEPGQYKITRYMDIDEPLAGTDADPWTDWRSIPVHTGGFLGQLIARGEPVIDNDLDLSCDQVLGNRLAKYRSLMAAPLYDDGQPLNWALFLRREPGAFESAHLEEALVRGNLVGGAVKQRLLNQQLRQANEWIKREIEQIAHIQRALLPAALPAIPGVELSASYQTFDEAGGDMYQVLPMLDAARHDGAEDPRWAIFIGDVSGHGPAAAVVMAMLHAILHSYPHRPEHPAEMLTHANYHLTQKRIDNSFVTAFLAFYDPTTRRLQYARAGHNPPVLKSKTKGPLAKLDDVGGVPLGVLDDTTYESSELIVEPEQTLVLYTDGITETRGPSGEWFGLEGIESSLVDCSGEPSCVIQKITYDLKRFEAGARPEDDQTILAMQVLADA